jgi:ABC-type nickel/cobalt efflux system permease component RcnA/Tol biopolymer transport system component
MAFFLILLLLLIPVSRVYAHAPDMYVQNLVIDMTSSGAQVVWKITPGPLLADTIWDAANQNLDDSISSDEAQSWVAPFLSGLSVSIDGRILDSIQVQSVHWPENVDVLRTGEDAIEILFAIQWPDGLVGEHSVEIHNSYLESNSINWFSLTAAKEGVSFSSPTQSNGQLRLNIVFPNASLTATPDSSTVSLTSWNSGTPNLPAGFTQSVSQLAMNLAASQPGGQIQQPFGSLNAVTTSLEGLVKTQASSPLFLLSAFLLSLVLGSLHALTPGHGKTLVAAYLVGSGGKVRDAVFLGAVVTTTHTGSVILLALVTLLASHYILPILITPWLEIFSGLLVIGFGTSLLVRRRGDLTNWLRRERNRSARLSATKPRLAISPRTASVTHMHAADLLHPHSHSHDSHDGHTHSHSAESYHGHSHATPAGPITWKSLLALGVSGGLVPCPDAIAILLVAVAVNRIPFGVLLIVAFSIGLALVLIAIGIAMVQGMQVVARSEALTRFSVYTPLISALVVTGLGVALTVSALNSFKFTSTILGTPSQTAARAQNVSTSRTESFNIKHARLLYLARENGQGRDQIYMLSLSGGEPVQWTQEPMGVTSYALSPDKKKILYTTFNVNGGSSIWTMKTDGTGRHLALNCPQAECDAPEWYPDNRKVVYERLEDTTDPSALPNFSLWWLDTQTGETMSIFNDQTFPSTAAAFSPDGQWLSYFSFANNAVELYHLQDGQNLSLPNNSQPAAPGTWSPSGDSILYWAPATSIPNPALHIKRYILNSGQTIDLGGAIDQADYSASWSPNGDWVAIDRAVSTPDNSFNGDQVWLVRPDSTDTRILVGDDQKSYSDLSWSPDGKFMLYSRYDYQNLGKFDIGLVDIQSGKQQILVPDGSYPMFLTQ